MKKYIISSLIITIIVFISIFISIPKKDNKILSKLVKNDTLAFTVDGKSVNEMPTKGSGYIASTIKCDKGSNFIWDNDNWEIEITDMKDKDKCVINFTKDTSNSNVVTIVKGESVTTSRQYMEINLILDSSSKTVSSDGSIIFYPKRNATLISVSGCNATIEDNKLIIKNITSSMECKLSGTATTMYDKLLSDNPTIKTRTNLAGVYQSSNTKTLYKIQENGTDVYYFSGNAQNNWVKFGDFYWRIIRTNADGSIRLLYHGTSTDSTSALYYS